MEQEPLGSVSGRTDHEVQTGIGFLYSEGKMAWGKDEGLQAFTGIQ